MLLGIKQSNSIGDDSLIDVFPGYIHVFLLVDSFGQNFYICEQKVDMLLQSGL